MPGFANLACIYLAAGEGRRFGGGKLEAELGGKMLGLHAAETLAEMGFAKLVAVSNADNSRLNPALEIQGFELAINPDPGAGQARSLALGIGAISEPKVQGALVALADMPFVTIGHLDRMVQAFDGTRPVCSTDGQARMPPAIFERQYWTMLTRLSGDRGARPLLADAFAVAADRSSLQDVDRPEDLRLADGKG